MRRIALASGRVLDEGAESCADPVHRIAAFQHGVESIPGVVQSIGRRLRQREIGMRGVGGAFEGLAREVDVRADGQRMRVLGDIGQHATS